MKISNFRGYQEKPDPDFPQFVNQYWHFATIDVTTGILWWKKTVPCAIVKKGSSPYWRFSDTGQILSSHNVDALYLSYQAKKLMEEVY